MAHRSAKPSVGLEPTTPSLPWKARRETPDHRRISQTVGSPCGLGIHQDGRARCCAPMVPVTCPFCVRTGPRPFQIAERSDGLGLHRSRALGEPRSMSDPRALART